MPYPGPRDPELYAQWRTARRAVSLQHHPDRGGEHGVLDDHLQQLDAAFSAREACSGAFADVELTEPPIWQPLTRLLRRARREMQARVRQARSTIPVGWPGSRRYFDV